MKMSSRCVFHTEIAENCHFLACVAWQKVTEFRGKVFFHTDYWTTTFPRNVCRFIPDYTALTPSNTEVKNEWRSTVIPPICLDDVYETTLPLRLCFMGEGSLLQLSCRVNSVCPNSLCFNISLAVACQVERRYGQPSRDGDDTDLPLVWALHTWHNSIIALSCLRSFDIHKLFQRVRLPTKTSSSFSVGACASAWLPLDEIS